MRVQPAEREAAARERILHAVDEVMPNVHGNPFIPHWPHPKQALFLSLRSPSMEDVLEALYGGAAGGGKSDALLMAAAQYAWTNGEFHGILFRRTHTDLAQPGALMDRALEWWLPAGVHWDGTNKLFTFPSGAKVALAYLKNPSDHLRYQGAEYHFTGWDELTQFLEAQYLYVGRSRVRRAAGSSIPLRTLSASNPGGVGHNWVKRRFVGGHDLETGREVQPKHLYLPATIQDNPSLDQRAYMRTLMHLHPTVREQLLRGDWSARDPGDYFRREWFGPLLDPEEDALPRGECVFVRWWDLAASERPDAKRTAGVLMLRHTSGVRAIVHARAFRATPGKRDDLIVQQARLDGRHVTVGLEIEPGSGGPAQFDALAKRLRKAGYRVVGARPGESVAMVEGTMRQPKSESGKAARADPVASCLERGYQRRGECEDTGSEWYGLDEGKPLRAQGDGLRLYVGPWTQEYLEEVEGFPEGELCDLVDATSGAWAWLEAHPAGQSRAPARRRQRAPAAGGQHDVHPSERASDRPRGHWRA